VLFTKPPPDRATEVPTGPTVRESCRLADVTRNGAETTKLPLRERST
jgi:hypothetical protein